MARFKDFDEALKQLGPVMPAASRDAWIWVNDTMELAKIIAQGHFGPAVTPDAVLGVYDRLVARLEPKPDDE